MLRTFSRALLCVVLLSLLGVSVVSLTAGCCGYGFGRRYPHQRGLRRRRSGQRGRCRFRARLHRADEHRLAGRDPQRLVAHGRHRLAQLSDRRRHGDSGRRLRRLQRGRHARTPAASGSARAATRRASTTARRWSTSSGSPPRRATATTSTAARSARAPSRSSSPPASRRARRTTVPTPAAALATVKGQVKVNEVLANGTGSGSTQQLDAIELYNTGTTSVNLAGWWLSDDKPTDKDVLPATMGSVIAPAAAIAAGATPSDELPDLPGRGERDEQLPQPGHLPRQQRQRLARQQGLRDRGEWRQRGPRRARRNRRRPAQLRQRRGRGRGRPDERGRHDEPLSRRHRELGREHRHARRDERLWQPG